MTAEPAEDRRRIGLVLGAGGLTGTAFHAGVLAALHDQAEWDPRGAAVVVGTSAGATSAALLRAGLAPRDYLHRVLGEPLSDDGTALLGDLPPLTQPTARARTARRPAAPLLPLSLLRHPERIRPGVVAAGLLPAGTRAVDAGAAGLRPMFSGWPARPLWIVAVSLADGRRVVFGKDPPRRGTSPSVADAVAASTAIPGYYAPVDVDGERLVDGGVASLHSLDLLADQTEPAAAGLDLIVVSAPAAGPLGRVPDPWQAWRLHAGRQLQREEAPLRRRGSRVLVLRPDDAVQQVMGSASMDLARRPPVARAAYAMACRELARRWPAD